MKAYLIEGSTGANDEFRTWTELVYLDKAKAELKVEELKAKNKLEVEESRKNHFYEKDYEIIEIEVIESTTPV